MKNTIKVMDHELEWGCKKEPKIIERKYVYLFIERIKVITQQSEDMWYIDYKGIEDGYAVTTKDKDRIIKALG